MRKETLKRNWQNYGNSKPFYSYLKNRTEARAGIGPVSKDDNSVTSDSREMAEILNRFFSSVFTAEDPNEEPPEAEAHANFAEDLTSKKNGVSKTRKLIMNLKTDSSLGPDKITPKLLQQIA